MRYRPPVCGSRLTYGKCCSTCRTRSSAGCEGTLEARGDYARVRGEQHHLECLARAALGIEQPLHFPGRCSRQRLGECDGARRELARAQVERGARQPHRIVQSLLYLDLEPAVDPDVDELE